MRVPTLIATMLLALSTASTGCGGGLAYNLPPAPRLMHPGPGVGGPGPGVLGVGNQRMAPAMPANYGPGGSPPMQVPGACSQGNCVDQCQYCDGGGCPVDGGAGCVGGGAMGATSQIQFVGEQGLTVAWDVSGSSTFDSAPLFVPGRQDFPQGAIYRLKLSNIPGRAGLMLYPTLEVAPVTPRTDAFLAHAAVPVQFTEEDFDQVVSGNFVTKVIYLPDPEFQELALSGVETLVSTRLDPGVDPVSEADRRGSILAVLRIGSKNLESAGGSSYQEGIIPAAYGEGCQNCAPSVPSAGPDFSGAPMQGAPMQGGPTMGGGMMPQGMPTAGMAPPVTPPHLMAGAPQYGLPHTGTPIGLPGPPHIPLGSPAGLRKHVMHNRTRVHLPPPTPQVKMSVKHRPGLNYPNPVTHVRVDEVNRAPFKPIHGSVKPGLGLRTAKQGQAAYGECDPCKPGILDGAF